jgi:transglutaminase-like putative cysteine protease
MKLFRFVFLTGAALSTISAAERWYEIRLAGAPTGYVHESVEPRPNGATYTTEEMLFVINRMGSKVEVRSKGQTLEDGAGLFVSLESETSSSQQTTTFHATRTATGIELQTRTGDKSYTRVIPVSEPIYGTEGAERLTREKANNKVTFAMFQPEFGGLVHYTRTLLSRDRLPVPGEGAVLEETSDTTPGITRITLDRDGNPIERSYDLPFGHVVARVTTRETALAAAEGSELPAESWGRTLAHSNIRLPDPRSIERVKLKLTQHHPELGWPTFDGPTQRVLEKTANTVVLEVLRPSLNPTTTQIDEASYLKPNALLQSDESEVMRLARTIAGNEPDRFKAARKLQDWSAANMKLGLGIAGAPASEVARNRSGTCIAYSILLASLDRAAGIPSRFAMGYVYVDGIWGAHAWTEVLVNGQWIPLDSAVYRPGIADAARFQFGSYTLDDQMSAATADGARMYGNIDVAVLEYTINGHTIRVPEGAPDHTIAGDTYGNQWLGISVRKPDGARFTTLDAVYPDSTVVAVESDSGKVTIEQAHAHTTVDGKPGLVVSSAMKTRLAIADGESFWVLTAEGNDGERLLNEVASGWKWISGK